MARTKTFILWPVALLCQIAALSIIMVLLKAGKGAYTYKAPYVPSEYMSFVDTSSYSALINGTKTQGLPDGLDFNRTKDFFVIYAARYCSGMKVNGSWKVDFCSYGGKEFFDQRVWRSWGIDLLQHGGTVGQAPVITFALTVTAMSWLIIDLICAWASLYYSRMILASSISSFVSATITFTLAGIAHVYTTTLVTGAKEMKHTELGVIAVKHGKTGTALLWATAGCTITATILYVVISIGVYRARKGSGATETTGYTTLDEEGHDMTSYSSQTTLVPQDKSHFAKEDSAYEPYRYQAATKSKE